MMQFFFADPGLRNNVGHHANIDRALITELRQRNTPLRVLAAADITPELKAEVGAEPFFRWPLYATTDGNRVSGWLNAFEKAALTTTDDFSRLDSLGADDFIYVPFVLPAQFKALAMWIARRPADRVPRVAMGFTFGPGMDGRTDTNGTRWSVRDSRVDPSAILFSHGASHIPKQLANRIRLVFPDQQGAALYGALMELPSATLPHYQLRVTEARNRAGARPINVCVLGDQRGPDKGYHLVPEIGAGLLKSHPDIRFLVHNANPGNWPKAQDAVRALAAADARVVLDEHAHNATEWASLLNTCDLLLCPYSPIAYQLMPSGLHSESVANGIPSVAPANTALSRILMGFGGGGTTFAEWTVPSILDATRRALDGFDKLAQAAHGGANQWQRTQGPQKIVDDLLGFWRS